MAWDPMSYSGNYSYRSDYDFGYGSSSTPAAAPKAVSGGDAAGAVAGIGTAALAAGPAGAIVAVGVAAFQVYSGLKQAESIRRQARLTAQLNELNAQYIEYDAWQAEAFGQTEQARYQTEIDKVAGEQKVNFAAADVDINYGTAGELRAETQLTGVLNKMEIQNQANQRSMGLKRQANNVRFSTTMMQNQAEAQAQAVTTQGVASGISTGISAYARK